MRYMIPAILLLASCDAPADPPDAPAQLTVSKPTTFIVDPLTPAGLPDYGAYLAARLSEGVTPENNAAIPLLHATGADYLSSEGPARQAILRRLGIELKPDAGRALRFREYLDGLHLNAADRADADAAFDSAQRIPWKPADHPVVDRWLHDAEASLDGVVAASRRSRFHLPIYASGESTFDAMVNLGGALSIIDVRMAMLARVNRSIGVGDSAQALEDLAAMRRLGSLLMSQAPTLLTRLVGRAMYTTVDDHIARLAASGSVDPHTLGRLIESSRRTMVPAYDADGVDVLERVGMLDQMLARRSPDTPLLPPSEFDIRSIVIQSGYPLERVEASLTADLLARVDWDKLFREANAGLDETVALMRGDDRQAMWDDHERTTKAGRDALDYLKTANPQGDPTRWMDAVFTAPMFDMGFTFVRVRLLHEQSVGMHRVALVAAMIAADHAATGRYPETLEELIDRGIAHGAAELSDPLGDGSLRYRRTDDGFVLYSVGVDGDDDGGEVMEGGLDDGDIVVESPVPDEPGF